MTDIEKIFVIIDPTVMVQTSLVMAESIARGFNARRTEAATLHVYCCINPKAIRIKTGEEPDQAHAEARVGVTDWIERLVAHTRSMGLTVETEVEIHQDWREATIAAIARQNCVLAIKGMARHPKLVRLFRDTADWKLLRDSACPFYLVKCSPQRRIRTVLAAIKHRTEKRVYTEANDVILDTARAVSESLGAELYVVTAYKDNFNYPDRQKFADRCGLPRNHVRAEMSSPQEAITTVAKEVGANLVVIARVGKHGATRDVGHTAEKVIDTLDANILVLPMTADSS